MMSVAVLRLHDFRLLMLARMFGMFALQAQGVIIGWQVYSITGDVFLLGLVGLIEAVPAIACAFFAGHIVDVNRPQKVYAVCMGILAANTFALFLLAGEIVTPLGQHLLPYLYAGVFISGVARSFIMPASFSILPRVVARDEISAASAWLNSSFQIAAICGPALAGVLYGAFNPAAAWLVPALMMACGCLAVCLMKVPYVPVTEKREPALKSIRAGWAFIFQNPTILTVMLLDMFAVLFGGAVALLPAYADQVLHVGSEGLGALRAAPALGAMVTALALALWPMKRIAITTMLWAVAGFGLTMIGFGLSTVFWFSMLCLALSGVFDSISVVIRATLVQLLTPQHMTGRVASVKSMFIISSNEIGAFESGTVARLIGLVPAVVLGGIGTLGVVAVTWFMAPRVRKTVIHAGEPVAADESKKVIAPETGGASL